MKAEITAYKQEYIQQEVTNDKGETQVQSVPVAVLTLVSEVPDTLPVGKIVEISVPKETKKKK